MLMNQTVFIPHGSPLLIVVIFFITFILSVESSIVDSNDCDDSMTSPSSMMNQEGLLSSYYSKNVDPSRLRPNTNTSPPSLQPGVENAMGAPRINTLTPATASGVGFRPASPPFFPSTSTETLSNAPSMTSCSPTQCQACLRASSSTSSKSYALAFSDSAYSTAKTNASPECALVCCSESQSSPFANLSPLQASNLASNSGLADGMTARDNENIGIQDPQSLKLYSNVPRGSGLNSSPEKFEITSTGDIENQASALKSSGVVSLFLGLVGVFFLSGCL